MTSFFLSALSPREASSCFVSCSMQTLMANHGFLQPKASDDLMPATKRVSAMEVNTHPAEPGDGGSPG